MKRINIRESLIQMDRDTSCKYDLTTMYESVSLTEEKKKELVKYIDAYDIDATNKFLGNEVSSQGLTEFYDNDFSDEEVASIMGGDTKNDNPDGLETPQETEKRLQENTNKADLETEIKTEVEHFMSELGFDSIDTEEATFIEVNEVDNNTLKITVEAEVYDDIKKLAKRLNTIVQKYDAKSRFKSVDFCVIEAYVRLNPSVNEDIDATNDTYTFISSKSVPDSDGFQDDYTWYKASDGTNVFVFGDNDIYKPEDGYFDHVEEDDIAAEEWFNSYQGFIEGDDMWEKLQSLEEVVDLKSTNDGIEDKVIDESVNFNLEEIKAVVGGKVSDYLHNELGYGNDFINDYVFVEVTPSDNDRVKVEVRAELSYEELSNLGEVLNNIISTYDSNAYFEPETAGILVAYIGNEDDKGEIDYDTVNRVSDKLNATKSFDELKQVYETEIVTNRDNWSRSTLDAIYAVVDELIDTYKNNESVKESYKLGDDENLCESNNVQFGVHQFSTNSIIFRGTEEECGKYIDKHKELWDDAEVYMMTPDDPHYKRTDESLNDSRYYKMVEYTYDGDDVSDYLGHIRVRTDSDKVALRAAEKYAMSKHPEDNPRHFKIVDDNYTNVDVVDSDGDYLTTLESVNESKSIKESANTMIYLFPELTDEDLEMAKAYGLQFLGKNYGANGNEDNWVLRGQESALRRYADKYLGYELHPDYLYDEEDFAGDIIKESITHNPLSTAGPIPYAVKLLYQMDKFVMDVYDNEGWLMNGVPDGEFEETTPDEAMQNYTEHDWLVTDIDTNDFSVEDFTDFLNTFKSATSNKSDYDQVERQNIISEAEDLLDTVKMSNKDSVDESKSTKEDSKSGYWYFTRHGVQPGSIPKGANVLMLQDVENGTYVKLDRVLTTKELNDYEIIEKRPAGLDESKSISEDYSDEVVTLSRYLDVEVPDICRGVLDLIEHLPSHKISYVTKICRDFYAKMESIIRHYTMTGDNFDVTEDFYPNEGETPEYAQYKYDTQHKEPKTFPLHKFGTEEDIDDLRNNTDYYVNRYDIKLNFTDSTFTVSGPDSDRFIRDYKLDECISENSSNDDVGCE